MIKKHTPSLLAYGVAVGILFFAVSTATAETQEPLRKEFKEARKEIREEASTTRATILQNAKDKAAGIRAVRASTTRASTTEALRENRMDTKEALQANRASTTAAIKEKRDELKNALLKRKAEKTEKRQKLTDEARTRVQTILNKAYNHLVNQIQRLAKVDARLDEKINELTVSGKDVSASKDLLVTAQTALTSARVAVQATQSLSLEQSGTTTSKEILKELSKKAEVEVKNAGQAYKKVADSLKPYLNLSASSTASSSVSVSASSTNQ